MIFLHQTLNNKAFTLLELIIVCGIVIIALTGLLATFVACLELVETTKNSQMAMEEAQRVLEEMRTVVFTSVYSSYNGYSFQVSAMPAGMSAGKVYINNTNADLLNATIGVCWEQRGGRIIGDCSDSGGTLIFNDNISLNSPVQIMTLITQR
jgi:type II secretory pathway pseudopilin PulG